MAKDSKKSFFELNQENPYKSPAHGIAVKSEVKTPDHNASEREEGELDASVMVAPVQVSVDRKEIKYLDMDNALDYEDVGSEQDESEVVSGKKANKSESMALAFGVQVKQNDLASEKNTKTESKEKNRRDKPSSGKNEAKVEKARIERSVERKDVKERGRRTSRSRSPQRRDTNGRNNRLERGGGGGGGGGGRSADQRRRRSRSVDRKPRRSPDRRRRTRSRDRRRSNSRSRRNRSRTRSRSKDRRNRRVSRSRSKSSRRDNDRKPKDISPPPAPKISSSLPDDKERLNKEKMMKRAEALLLLKDHMRKEIEEQKRLAELKAREPPAVASSKNDKELAMLEKMKSDTLDKLRKQEEIKQLAAVKKVLEVVAAGVKNAHSKKKRDQRDKSSSSSSSSSEDDRKGSRSDRRKRARKYSSSD